MSRYKCDPRWIRVRFKGNGCVRCKRPISLGACAFFTPRNVRSTATGRIVAKR
jgi:hypothetical protein